MNRSMISKPGGFTLIEVLMVMVIIAALVSIAIPGYVKNREQAEAVSCLSNRRHIESEEAAYFLANQKPSLKIDDKYRCPSGGTYVWLISDPSLAGYPKVACSAHYIGADEIPDQVPETGADETPDQVPETGANETPEQVPEPNDPMEAARGALDDLIDYVAALGLPGKVESDLTKWIDKAQSHLEKDQISQARTSLDAFQRSIDKNSETVDSDEAALLKQKAMEIQELLK